MTCASSLIERGTVWHFCFLKASDVPLACIGTCYFVFQHVVSAETE